MACAGLGMMCGRPVGSWRGPRTRRFSRWHTKSDACSSRRTRTSASWFPAPPSAPVRRAACGVAGRGSVGCAAGLDRTARPRARGWRYGRGDKKAGADTDDGFRGRRWLRPATLLSVASSGSSARSWRAIPANRGRPARSRRRGRAMAASGGAAAMPVTTTGSSASIESSSPRSCTRRNRRLQSGSPSTRTARRGGSSWPGCRAKSPSAAPSTCFGTASSTVRTTSTCSTVRRPPGIRRRRGASSRTGSRWCGSSGTAATRRSGRSTSGCSSTACQSSPSS